jgi:hypothetical protein
MLKHVLAVALVFVLGPIVVGQADSSIMVVTFPASSDTGVVVVVSSVQQS